MKEIILSCGVKCFVDDNDYAELSKYKWHLEVNRTVKYAIRRPITNGKRHKVTMYSQIMSYPASTIDHIDGNGLNNTRDNLRLATVQENCFNRKTQQNSRTGYKGVSYYKGKFMARITYSGTTLFLGLFDTKEEAARAYNRTATEYFGRFAHVNVIKV